MEKIENIKKALDVAKDLLCEYCENYDVYVMPQEDIEQCYNEEDKQYFQVVKDMNDIIKQAQADLKEIEIKYIENN